MLLEQSHCDTYNVRETHLGQVPLKTPISDSFIGLQARRNMNPNELVSELGLTVNVSVSTQKNQDFCI